MSMSVDRNSVKVSATPYSSYSLSHDSTSGSGTGANPTMFKTPFNPAKYKQTQMMHNHQNGDSDMLGQDPSTSAPRYNITTSAATTAAGMTIETTDAAAITTATTPAPTDIHKDDSLMFFEFDIQEYIGCSLKFRVKAVVVTLNDKNDDFIESHTHNIASVSENEYNANRLKNDIKTKCEKLKSEDITSSFPNSEWAKLKDPFLIPSKIHVTKEFIFQNPFDKNGILYYLGKSFSYYLLIHLFTHS